MKFGAKDLKRRLVLHYEFELHGHAFDDVNEDDDGEHSEVASRSSAGTWGPRSKCAYLQRCSIVRLPHAFM